MKINKKSTNYNFAYLKIKPTSNNIFITLTDVNGNVLISKHAGLLDYKGSKKKTRVIVKQKKKTLIDETF